MKLTSKIFALLSLTLLLLTYSGCSNKPPVTPSDEEVQLGKLSKTWKATSVKKDNVDQTGYANFTLKLEGVVGAATYGYATTGRPTLSPWLSSGNWNFDADPLTSIIRDKGTVDELKMTYSVTETTLQITYTFNGAGYPGRVNNVKGTWVMVFGL